MEKNVDRRIRKTRLVLRRGLTKLMREKPVNEISVRELAELCDINRGTFYLHYKDVYDMVETLQQELYEEFHALLVRHTPTDESSTALMLIDLFRFIEENKDLASAILGKYGNSAFIQKMTDEVKRMCAPVWDRLERQDRLQFERYYSFMVNGAIGVVREWVQADCPERPEDIGMTIKNIIYDGLRHLG
ncbi:MAG: TetR/AcrR family transcriptional regulator C-terminal domain-containing protein [Oscillospiraceae bacterium]|nr:TetR/AcrR family transcriptional regulator C-terminal domain-containing protein [Oscillospiraceae bacterium]